MMQISQLKWSPIHASWRILMALMLLCLAAVTSQAGTLSLGSADGSFESGLGGMSIAGDV
jgi:hypothetical protein